jgi:hypothetical protein
MGMTLALPMFESIGLGASNPSDPRRLVFIYAPNGMHAPDWKIRGSEPDTVTPLPAELPRTLRELERHRDHFSVLGGLTLDKARNNGDGPGDHARAGGAFLTCAQPVKGNGTTLGVGVSADQIAARSIGTTTPFSSLQLGSEPGMHSGQCDSGYPCAYSSNISWSTPHTPLLAETNPRVLFDRLFGLGLADLSPEDRARRIRTRRSVLDFVREDARRISNEMGSADRRKLEEYLDGIRELELRIHRATDPVAIQMERPTSIPPTYSEHAAMMFELLKFALATDSTRVATFMLANESSNRCYHELGINEGHHVISHHAGDGSKIAQIAAINRHHLQLFAVFLDSLSSHQEQNGSLLDSTQIVYGSGIKDGSTHAHHDLPILLAGGASDGPRRGHHLCYPVETPLANLYLRLFADLGVRDKQTGAPLAHFGDSTGVLTV